MEANEIRRKFIEYYVKRGHEEVLSVSLIPKNDPTTLFTGSGMQPMMKYLLGTPYPSGATRVVNSQKCFRGEDIEEVGDNRHTTFFEMVGNWSFGDYWKEEQLRWIFEFLVDGLGLDPEKLYPTVFFGDEENGISKDIESAEIWKTLFKERGIEAKEVEIGGMEEGHRLGMQNGRIFYYDGTKNWWWRGSGGPGNMVIGEPGGPDSEIFYDFGTEHDPEYGEKCHPNCDCGRFLEFANSVFMQFKKIGEGKFKDLPEKNIDFGAGLERIVAAVNGDPDIFSTDLFSNAIREIEKSTEKKYEDENLVSMRVIADHLKGATFMLAEGILPSNKQQGYVLRRLIRRSAVKMHKLDSSLDVDAFVRICHGYLNYYGDLYFDVRKDKPIVEDGIRSELEKFSKSLQKGLREIEKKDPSDMDAKFIFDLYQTHGFPLEITQEILEEKGVSIDEKKFNIERERHSELSRTSSVGVFKGGLGDTSEETIWYHTLTHLLHQALRDVLGDEVVQAGSNITSERLRFDFAFDRAMTDEEIKEVEKSVNQQKNNGLEVKIETMPLSEALDTGALSLFKEKYPEKVNVYTIGDYSREICGGPHVKNTAEIKGTFKIVKEKSSGAGVRRIRAVIE